MAKKGFDKWMGYKSPDDVYEDFKKVQAWIQTVGVAEATKHAARWFRTPIHKIPWFVLENNVRDYMKHLKQDIPRTISAEVRVLWCGFHREILPKLDEVLEEASQKAPQETPKPLVMPKADPESIPVAKVPERPPQERPEAIAEEPDRVVDLFNWNKA